MTEKQDHLHVKGCACLEDHPERRFLCSAMSYRHAYQIASQNVKDGKDADHNILPAGNKKTPGTATP